MTKQLSKTERKSQIMDAALTVAAKVGYQNIRRADVAKEAKVADGLVSLYWGTMPQLRRAIMRKAITTGHLGIIAQGLVIKDKTAMKAPEELRLSAISQLIN